MAITEREWPASSKRPIVLAVRGMPLSDQVCTVEGCAARLGLRNRTGICRPCQNKRLWTCETEGCENKRRFNIRYCEKCLYALREERPFVRRSSWSLKTLEREEPLASARVPIEIPEWVLNDGKNGFPRGFWVGLSAGLWHKCRRRDALPPGYVAVAQVVPAFPVGWQVLSVE